MESQALRDQLRTFDREKDKRQKKSFFKKQPRKRYKESGKNTKRNN